MTKPHFFIYVLVVAVGAAIAAPIAIHFVDQATARQCKNHDWPIKADRVHKDWCVDNGYQI